MILEVLFGCCEIFPPKQIQRKLWRIFPKFPDLACLESLYFWSQRGVRLVRFRRKKRARNGSTLSKPNEARIWTVLKIVRFCALAAFKPLRDLKRTCR